MRIVLADDSTLLREGVQLILTDAGHQVVAGVGDAPTLVEAALRERPDLVITDVRMPPTGSDDGLRAAVEIRQAWPDARIVVLSQYVVQAYADQLLVSGAAGVGYLLKDRIGDIDEFLAAIDQVAAGGTVLDPDVVSQLMVRAKDPVQSLTPREREVLELMAQGLSNGSIAGRLFVTGGAVEKHTQRIFAKLGLSPDDSAGHRRVLAVLAYLRGSD
ncbi:response regulator transcription factor [Yimella sp. NH-Cas1]|uniref:response regulator n=1 Tax=Yimella sp. NH-Cas1 TaxID=2917726 RepID=UPI001EFAD8CD|nr:response regulator transcription factor [Yimella sp. NH-Cas1]MCG8656303.1 response regulator transcription factor [Yimella sp. NH-Cas1]